MKADRYHELLSKINTDNSTDEKIIKRLQKYKNNKDNLQKNRLDTTTSYTYDSRGRGSSLRIRPKVSVLRQALSSLAFLIILTISIYGLVTGLNKNRNNSQQIASSDTNVDTANGITDLQDDFHYVVTADNAETVNTSNYYFKNDTYSEDLKIYLRFNDASKVTSLFIQSLGTVNEANYMVDGNIITIWKEYLDTLPEGLYSLSINMDKGNPAFAHIAVRPEDEESEFGFYFLSNYYWDYYLSNPKDFTFLVSNRKEARITGLRNGSVTIDPSYYNLEENGYVATLYQSYMTGMEEGVRFDLIVEFSDGMEKTIGIKIRSKEVNAPILNSEYNIFEKSKPADVKIKVIWNDATYITSIDPKTHFAVKLSSNDYTLDNDTFTIKKEFLSSLDAGEYLWYLMFDTETGADIRIMVND